MLDYIEGSMGKGGGGHTPIEANDTLRSRQTIKLLLALGEGPWPEDAIEEVYLNRVPISNFSASYIFRSGTPTQDIIPGFVTTEAPLEAFTSQEIKTTTPWTGSVGADVDAVRITLFVPELKQFLDNGDLVGYSVSLSFYTSIDGVSYSFVKTSVKKGKASSKYAWDIEVERPANAHPTNPWYVRVVRDSADNTSVKRSNKSWIGGVIKLYYQSLAYPNTALLAITATNADEFGGQVPEITIKGRFRKVKVPSNTSEILPNGRLVYSGNWNLSFDPVLRWTSNLAWVIFDVLNSSATLDIPETDIDKAAFYTFSQYCDQLVPDGKGGEIPRYHIGYQFVSRENVPSFLADLLSLGNARLFTNTAGQVSIFYDRAGIQPSKIIANSNVIEGVFNYSSNDLEGRTTLVNVTYNNFDSFADTDTATVPGAVPSTFEEGLIGRYGLQVSDIVLPGCRYEAQALRKARWALYTNCVTSKFVSFKVFMQGLMFTEGEHIIIMDSENRQVMQHAVIKGSVFNAGLNKTILTLDRALVIPDEAYTVNFYNSDGTGLVEKSIFETNGTFSSISFLGNTPAFVGTTCIFEGATQAKSYLVTGIEKDEETYTIAAVEYDENKYTYIDSGITLPPVGGDFVNISDFTVEAVTDLNASPTSSNDGLSSNIKLNVFWNWDLDGSEKYKANFYAVWRRDNLDYIQVRDIAGYSFDIDNLVPGSYEVTVWAVNPATNVRSAPVSLAYNYRTVAGQSSLHPPVNARVTNTAGLTFNTPDLSLSFDYNILNEDVDDDVLKDYVVEIWDVAGTDLKNTYIVAPNSDFNGVFKFPFSENVLSFGTATRSFQIKLYSRDLTGFVSLAYAVNVSNAVPAAPSFTLLSGVGSTFVNITPPADSDVAGYIIYRRNHSTSPWTPIPADAVYDGPDTYVNIGVASAGEYDFRVAAYDTFGKTGLNIAPVQSSTTLTAETDKFAFTGLSFTPNSPVANSVSWTSGTVSINGAAPTVINAGNAAWTSGTLYICFDKASATLFTTTDITIAVTKSQILAAYAGGTNLKGGDGTAFFNGSQVLAQSIGANQLVANTAIITQTAQLANAVVGSAAIADAAITNAKIGNEIQSTNWNSATKEGWKIDKTGVIETYGKVKIGTPNVGVGTPTSTFVPGPLTLAGNALLNNSIIKKQGATTAWDEQGYSAQNYTSACACRFSFAQNNAQVAAGLSINPSANTLNTGINYAIQTKTDGTFEIRHSGTLIADSTSYIFTAGTTTFSGNATFTSNSISKPSGTAGWTTQAYSAESYFGNCGLRFKAGQTNEQGMIGLSETPTTTASYTAIDYAIYFNNGTINIYESGTLRTIPATSYTTSDVFEITYRNGFIYYLKNGTSLRTIAATAATWFIDSSLYSVGCSITDIVFGAYNDPLTVFSFTPDDSFEIKYFGSTIEYYKNNALFWTNSATAGQTLHFDSAFYTQNAIIDQIQFGQYQVLTPDYGARMEIGGDALKIYDRNNILRVQLGNLNS